MWPGQLIHLYYRSPCSAAVDIVVFDVIVPLASCTWVTDTKTSGKWTFVCDSLLRIIRKKSVPLIYPYHYRMSVLKAEPSSAITDKVAELKECLYTTSNEPTSASLKLQRSVSSNNIFLSVIRGDGPPRCCQTPYLMLPWQSAFVESRGSEPKPSCCSVWRAPRYIQNTCYKERQGYVTGNVKDTQETETRN